MKACSSISDLSKWPVNFLDSFLHRQALFEDLDEVTLYLFELSLDFFELLMVLAVLLRWHAEQTQLNHVVEGVVKFGEHGLLNLKLFVVVSQVASFGDLLPLIHKLLNQSHRLVELSQHFGLKDALVVVADAEVVHTIDDVPEHLAVVDLTYLVLVRDHFAHSYLVLKLGVRADLAPEDLPDLVRSLAPRHCRILKYRHAVCKCMLSHCQVNCLVEILVIERYQ
jgi:hypothetical protein